MTVPLGRNEAPPAVVVVLVEPAGARNLGSIARLCANFGVRELRLVAPRCEVQGDEARQMAVHAGWVLEQARQFSSLQHALADCRRVVACSGRCAGEPLPLTPLEPALDWLLAPAPAADGGEALEPPPRALVFGREDRGLSNDELLQAGRLLHIETGPLYGSLNLSHAAAVVLQAVHRRRGQTDRRTAATAPAVAATAAAEPCPRAEVEALLADAEALLLAVGFLYPHTAHARMAKLRALLQRAEASSAEVALLRGMVRQLRWASQRSAGAPDAASI